MITVLGAGLAGISASYHLGHENCQVFERNSYVGGHIHSHKLNGFTWDEGPHVSFTKHNYVKELFAQSLDDQFLEYKVFPTNYYQGSWIPHPAQSNLYAIPEPLRTECFRNFLSSRRETTEDVVVSNYKEWLDLAFGETFARTFPGQYTKKYWTVAPDQLATEWVGNRVFFPDVATVEKGYHSAPNDSTHYITSVRYPNEGGYISFAAGMLAGMNVSFEKEVKHIDLAAKRILFSDGSQHEYTRLVSTMPLPEFVRCCDAPADVREAAANLVCSQLLLVNVEVNHPATRDEHWLYVYDEDKYATRINFTELLSPNNGPAGKCGIQVEVYFSAKYNPIDKPFAYYKEKVIDELVEMGLIIDHSYVQDAHTKWVEYANVVFDLDYRESLDKIFNWLSFYGLAREADDLHPMTNWSNKFTEHINLGDIVLAGRFAQWKYYWTDDCVMRGKLISCLV